MTIHHPPSEDELRSGICLGCLKEAREQIYDESFSDSFGLVSDCSVASKCCEADVVEGKIIVDERSQHRANKDHEGTNIKKGDFYIRRIVKGWYIEDDVHKGIFKITKRKVS